MKILKTSEVAERLRCSEWKVYMLIKKGTIKPIKKLGKPHKFNEEAINRLIR